MFPVGLKIHSNWFGTAVFPLFYASLNYVYIYIYLFIFPNILSLFKWSLSANSGLFLTSRALHYTISIMF